MLSYRVARPKTSTIKKIMVVLTIIATIAIMLTAQISNGSFEESTIVGSRGAATGERR